MRARIGIGISVIAMLLPAATFAHPHQSDEPFCPQVTSHLTRGMRDSAPNGHISQLQHFLAHRYHIPEDQIVTGYFGSMTRGVVGFFQQENGIQMTGTIGPLTRAKIHKICAAERAAYAAERSAAVAPASPATIADPASTAPAQSTVTFIAPPTHILTNGSSVVYRFSVTAHNAPLTIPSLKVRLSRFGGVELFNLRVFVFSDAGFSSPIPPYADGKAYAGADRFDSPSGVVSSSDIDMVFSSPLTIPAGETRYVSVMGDVGRVEDFPDYVTAKLVGGVEGMVGDMETWWLTHDGIPSSVRGGYNLMPGQAAAAAVFYDQLVHAFTALGALLE